MRKLILIAAIACFASPVMAQDKPQTRLQVCAKEWKTVKPTMDIKKGEGREAWNKFRSECIAKLPKPERKPRAKASEA